MSTLVCNIWVKLYDLTFRVCEFKINSHKIHLACVLFEGSPYLASFTTL